MNTFSFDNAPVSDIAEIVTNEYNVPTDYTGIRIFDADCTPKIGDKLECSRVWDDNNPTCEYLGGTCAIEIKWDAKNLNAEIERSLVAANSYGGEYVVIIGGDSAEYGIDRGEIIIRNAIVLAVWRNK